MKAPVDMTNGEINRRLDSLDKQASKLTQDFIDAGRGHERPSEIRNQNDALSKRWIKIADEQRALYIEAERRYGPGFISRLPTRGGRTIRRKNPTMATKKKAKRKATPAQLRALKKGRATMRKKRAAAKRNPAYSNQSLYRKARAVARGSRKVNPKGRKAPTYVIASINKRDNLIVYWTAFGWGYHSKAVRFPDVKGARHIAKKMTREVAIADEDKTGAEIRAVIKARR